MGFNGDKTPYELRMEILHMAYSICEHNSNTLVHYLETNSHVGDVVHDSTNEEPPHVKVEDVLAIARSLNEFISNG
jgi:hypothetical protein